jgi:hypothetical protein
LRNERDGDDGIRRPQKREVDVANGGAGEISGEGVAANEEKKRAGESGLREARPRDTGQQA